MTSAEKIASNYIATWNAEDAADRAELIADHWSAEPRYVDPLMAAKGCRGTVRDHWRGA